jgi:hypothetical protein
MSNHSLITRFSPPRFSFKEQKGIVIQRNRDLRLPDRSAGKLID